MTAKETIKRYKSINEFLNSLGLEMNNDNYRQCYATLVHALDFEVCKEIALSYADLNTYIKAYNEDEFLNNMLDNWHRASAFHPLRKFNCKIQGWDELGYKMLHNPKATVRFDAISLCCLTSTAKQAVRMMCEEAMQQ